MRRLFLAVLTFLFLVGSAYSVEPIKIKSLVFDNSDNLIYLDTLGSLGEVGVDKGALEGRVYFDITNASLVGGAKTFVVKNSKVDSVKISQFKVNPNIVRLVLNTKNGPEDFKVVKKGDRFLIKYGSDIASNTYFNKMYEYRPSGLVMEDTTIQNQVMVNLNKPVVSVDKNGDEIKAVFEAQSEVSTQAALKLVEKKTNIKSLYYLDSMSITPQGIMVKGMGMLGPAPPIVLTNPSRAVFDVNNAILSQNLKNKEFRINETEKIKFGQFDNNTVRIVITTPTPADYKEVVSADLQNFLISTDSKLKNIKLSDRPTRLLTFEGAKFNKDTIVFKVNFSAPAVTSFDQLPDSAILDFYNCIAYDDVSFSKVTSNDLFSDIKAEQLSGDRLRINVPLKNDEKVKYEMSADSKSVRIFISKPQAPPKPSIISMPDIVPAIKTPTTISSYYKVVIDAGHGGSDVGAMRGTSLEKDITLSVSKYLADYLTNQNVHVDMTRRGDDTVSLKERCDFSNEKQPDIFVSVHVNASVATAPSGIETHWYHQRSLGLAQVVHKSLSNQLKVIDRGLMKSQFYVINHTEAPSILVEIGFISNDEERRQLLSEQRQKATAKAIAEGVMTYLKNRSE